MRALKMVVALLAGVVVALAIALIALEARSAVVPVGGLHSVWCVKQGYPADLALPVVVGPGTGLSGCPSGERQVREP